MPALLLKLLPLRDWCYIGAIVALLIGFGLFVRHERVVGASHEVTVVQAASKKAEAVAAATIKALTTQHDQELTKVKSTYEATIQNDAAIHASDAKRLRDYEASHSGSNGLLPRAPTGQSPNGTVQQGAQPSASGSTGIRGVAEISPDLANSIRVLDASLTACQADRNSLTGK